MERYCITLEQAKNLIELGFNSVYVQWWWVEYDNGKEVFLTDYNSIINDAVVKYPAYHVGELGEILENRVVKCIEYDDGTWNSFCYGKLLGKFSSEAQSRGALLIYLLGNKLL